MPPPIAASRPSAAFSTIAALAIRTTRSWSPLSRNAWARIPCSQEWRCMASAACATFSRRASLIGAPRLGRTAPRMALPHRNSAGSQYRLFLQCRISPATSRISTTRDGLHGLVIGKGPDHPLYPALPRSGEEPCRTARVQPVAHDGVAVRQPVQPGHELQADSGQLFARTSQTVRPSGATSNTRAVRRPGRRSR